MPEKTAWFIKAESDIPILDSVLDSSIPAFILNLGKDTLSFIVRKPTNHKLQIFKKRIISPKKINPINSFAKIYAFNRDLELLNPQLDYSQNLVSRLRR